jgi:hypothetical protein
VDSLKFFLSWNKPQCPHGAADSCLQGKKDAGDEAQNGLDNIHTHGVGKEEMTNMVKAGTINIDANVAHSKGNRSSTYNGSTTLCSLEAVVFISV